jgi:uncharacterized membrane protein YphA (DoxX/SURF4 family)
MQSQDQGAGNWPVVQRIAFWFVFLYLVLYNLPFPFGMLPHTVRVAQEYESLWLKLVPWIGTHVLHLNYEIATSTNCSSDTTYDFAKVLCFLTLAGVNSILWSFADPKHANYQRLHDWLRLYVRLSVGAAILYYGATKIFLVHFPPPNLYKLLEPLGDYSRMSLLWTFMGTSRSYTVFAGCVQMLGGALLFVPRLTTLGALINLTVFSNIFALNLAYDVPVKLYSFHLVLQCLFLLLPDARRLVGFFLLNHSVAEPPYMGLFTRPRLNTVALLVQLMLGGVLVSMLLYRTHDYENRHFRTAARPPFYGIWIVDEFTFSGKELPPVVSDEVRWLRVVFQFPQKVRIESLNGSWMDYWLQEDMAKKKMAIGRRSNSKQTLEFVFSYPDSRSLTLEGREGEDRIRVKLHRLDEKQFAVLDRDVHLIDDDAVLIMDEERVCDRVRKPGQESSLWR